MRVDPTPPTHRTKVNLAVGIWDMGAIDDELIVMNSFIEGSGITNPGSVFSLDKFCAIAKRGRYFFGLRSNDTKLDTALRIDLWVLLTRLIGRGRFEIVLDALRSFTTGCGICVYLFFDSGAAD